MQPEAYFYEDFGIDSLDFCIMLQKVEDEFGVTINEEDAENIFTVQDLVDWIDRHI